MRRVLIKHSFAVFAVLCVLCACTKTIYVPQVEVRTEYKERVKIDSFITHDSVYVSMVAVSDTVYKTEYRYKTAYRDRNVIIHDSIPYEVVVHDTTKIDVPAKITGWQRFNMRVGNVFLFLVLAVLIAYTARFAIYYIRNKK